MTPLTDEEMKALAAAGKRLPQDSWPFDAAYRFGSRARLDWKRPCGHYMTRWVDADYVREHWDRLDLFASKMQAQAERWWADSTQPVLKCDCLKFPQPTPKSNSQ